MVILEKDYKPVILRISKLIKEEKIRSYVVNNLQQQYNEVAKQVGYSNGENVNVGGMDLFGYCEKQGIESEALEELFSLLNNF